MEGKGGLTMVSVCVFFGGGTHRGLRRLCSWWMQTDADWCSNVRSGVFQMKIIALLSASSN